MDYKDIFDYSDGQLIYKSARGRMMAGDRAGSFGVRGYRQVKVDNKLMREHRVIFEMFNGAIPVGMDIDHINGIRDDNRIENLRLATEESANRSENRVITKSCWPDYFAPSR